MVPSKNWSRAGKTTSRFRRRRHCADARLSIITSISRSIGTSQVPKLVNSTLQREYEDALSWAGNPHEIAQRWFCIQVSITPCKTAIAYAGPPTAESVTTLEILHFPVVSSQQTLSFGACTTIASFSDGSRIFPYHFDTRKETRWENVGATARTGEVILGIDLVGLGKYC